MKAVLANLMRKGWKWALIAVVLGLIVYKVRFGPVPVAIQPVAVGEVVAEVMGTGTLEAHYQATVSAKIQGLILELLVDQNDWVKLGQPLARLDDSDLKREVTTQEAVMDAAGATVERTIADEARAKALLEQARLDYNRYSGLLGSKSISQEQMDKTSQNLAVAEAELSRASAAIAEARRQQVAARERLHFQQARLADTRITAPFDGLIIRRDREVGDIVVPGASIFILVSVKEMWISAWVDESAMDGLAPGQPARIVFRSKPGHEYRGKVTRLGQEVDRETREFRVDVGVDSLPKNWGVGQRAEVYIETDRKSGATNVPFKAVVWRKGKAGVYVADGGRAHWRGVSLGLRGLDKVEITKGLSKDEKVIAGPDPSHLTDGQRVYAQ
ncbi:MAG: efflux RND transporter periplasmic adaptor subunit [Desulfomonilaceae bacterium]